MCKVADCKVITKQCPANQRGYYLCSKHTISFTCAGCDLNADSSNKPEWPIGSLASVLNVVPENRLSPPTPTASLPGYRTKCGNIVLWYITQWRGIVAPVEWMTHRGMTHSLIADWSQNGTTESDYAKWNKAIPYKMFALHKIYGLMNYYVTLRSEDLYENNGYEVLKRAAEDRSAWIGGIWKKVPKNRLYNGQLKKKKTPKEYGTPVKNAFFLTFFLLSFELEKIPSYKTL